MHVYTCIFWADGSFFISESMWRFLSFIFVFIPSTHGLSEGIQILSNFTTFFCWKITPIEVGPRKAFVLSTSESFALLLLHLLLVKNSRIQWCVLTNGSFLESVLETIYSLWIYSDVSIVKIFRTLYRMLSVIQFHCTTNELNFHFTSP